MQQQLYVLLRFVSYVLTCPGVVAETGVLASLPRLAVVHARVMPAKRVMSLRVVACIVASLQTETRRRGRTKPAERAKGERREARSRHESMWSAKAQLSPLLAEAKLRRRRARVVCSEALGRERFEDAMREED